MRKFFYRATLCWFALVGIATAAEPTSAPNAEAPGTELLNEYFRLETDRLSSRCLADVQTAEDWNKQRAERHQELCEMLGLSPFPEKTPLNTEIVETRTIDDIIVENLHFQSRPGLYVTANLYRPKEVKEKLPAILYMCGHAVVKENGVSLGNKTSYQHHGAWYAKNGYVCLTIDTIQLGEIPGLHHGTHNLGMWWWLNRGYTPAGVEAWNAVRAIDYLQSRPEVDPERIGATGRSGGGASTWFIAALDERIKAAAPVAGITNLENHIVDGCVAGHCDCMFMVNRYGWDFPMLAALIAPRPLLIINTDRDPIFPLDGVVDIHVRSRRLYKILGADNNTGLFLCQGGHVDSQHLQNASFEWFNRFLKKHPVNAPVEIIATKLATPSQLKVFEQLPQDEKVTVSQEWFIPERTPNFGDKTAKASSGGYRFNRAGLHAPNEVTATLAQTQERDGLRLRTYEFDSEKPYRLQFLVLDAGKSGDLKKVNVNVLEPLAWDEQTAELQGYFNSGASKVDTEGLKKLIAAGGTQVYVTPRGAGKTRWTDEKKAATHIRRRFYLLGTTDDERRTIDIANALAGIQNELVKDGTSVTVTASGLAAGWTAFSGALVPSPVAYTFTDLPFEKNAGPFYLNLDQESSLPEVVVQLARSGHPVKVKSTSDENQAFWNEVLKKSKELGVSNLTSVE